jgi:hypothetical protein
MGSFLSQDVHESSVVTAAKGKHCFPCGGFRYFASLTSSKCEERPAAGPG